MSKAMNSRRRGFTLIEVMLVLLILVILASLVAVATIPYQRKAKIDAARAQIGNIEKMIKMYQFDMDTYPSSLDSLLVQPNDAINPAKWNGPYADKQIPLDPWERRYEYQCPGTHNPQSFDLWSQGPPNENTIIGNW